MPYVMDVTGRGPSTSALARRGLLAFGVLAVVVGLLLMQYRGAFRDTFPATALVTEVGDGVRPGADVKLRGVLVGTVAEVRPRPAEPGELARKHEIDLELRPEFAASIPANVTARVVPTNVFGAPAVELLDPPDPSGPMLARGGVIRGDESEQTRQLQTVMNQLNRLVRSMRPAKLNVALSNIAQALDGRGETAGSLVSGLDAYLSTLNKHTDDFSADLRLLGASLRGLADASPALLDAVGNAVVTAQTLVTEQERLAASLTGATATGDELNGFLADNSDRVIRVVRDTAGIATTLAPQRLLIPRALGSLARGTEALGAGVNRNGALSLVLSTTPFQPYTAADCPRYPGLAGPNCTDRKARKAEPVALGGSVGPVGGRGEASTIHALLGGDSTGAAGVLLLGPIVRGATVVVPA